MTYASDDVVTTRDGRRHRVIYQTGNRLFVKSTEDKHRKAYFIECGNVVDHTRRASK